MADGEWKRVTFNKYQPNSHRGDSSKIRRKEQKTNQNYGQVRGASVFTLFVDNIHPKVNNGELKAIFQRIGVVEDVFISRKARIGRKNRFGFVRFNNQSVAEEAVRRINDRLFEGERLFVKKARFERKRTTISREEERKIGGKVLKKYAGRTKRWVDSFRDNRTFKQVLVQKEDRNQNDKWMNYKGTESKGSIRDQKLRVVKVDICKENVEWLLRSLIAETEEQENMDKFSVFLGKLWPAKLKVRSIGKFQFIITFNTTVDMEAAYGRYIEELNESGWFVRKWNENVVCKKRLVWLEVIGVPPQAWCKKNLELLVQQIGAVVNFDPVTEQGVSLDSAKLLVITSLMPYIEDRFLLEVEDVKFEVFIRELGRSSDTIQMNKAMDSVYEDPSCAWVPETAMEDQSRRTKDDVAEESNSFNRAINEPPVENALRKDEGRIFSNKLQNTKRTFNSFDGVEHLPPRGSCGDIRMEEQGLTPNLMWELEESHNETALGHICYNLDEERALIGETHEVSSEPPGFNLKSPSNGKANNVGISNDVGQSQRTKLAKENRGEASGRNKRKCRKKKIVKTFPSSSIEGIPSTEEEMSNDESEARRTWEMGKDLNLVARNEDGTVVREIVRLRRSGRQRKNTESHGV